MLLLPWRRLRKGQHDPFGLIVSQSGLSLLLLDELVDGSACVALFAFRERREDLCSFGCGPSCVRHTHSRSSRWMLGAHAYCLDEGSRNIFYKTKMFLLPPMKAKMQVVDAIDSAQKKKWRDKVWARVVVGRVATECPRQAPEEDRYEGAALITKAQNMRYEAVIRGDRAFGRMASL